MHTTTALLCVGGVSARAAGTVVHVNVDAVRGKHVSQVTSCWAFSPEASVGLVCCVKWHYSTGVHMLLGWTGQRLDDSTPSLS